MPSTYTLNNGIELIGTGEQSGTWGDTTNTNFELLDTALDGQVSVTLAATGSSGSPNTLPISDGASSNGRNRLVIFGDGGDLGGTAFVQLTPNDAEKIIYVRNNLSGSRSILLFQGTYNASNDYEVPAGTTAVVFFNGAGSGAVAANVFNNAYFDSLRLGSVSVTAILDEDNMASDSATALATQQSIKAYVDTQVGANNELSEVLANGNTTGGTDIAVSTGDDITFADSSKAIFGAGSDLQIYHDGSNSYVKDNGTGDLYLQGTANVRITNTSGQKMFLGQDGGEAQLYYSGVEKLATTSTGVDITGTLTSDALNVSAASPNIDVTDTGTSHASQDFLTNSNAVRATIGVERSSGGGLFVGSSPYAAVFGTASAGNTEFATNNNVRMTISSSGSVGIGTSSPTADGLQIVEATQSDFFMGNTADPDGFRITYNSTDTSIGTYSNTPLRIRTNATERMRIDNSGVVIINQPAGTSDSGTVRITGGTSGLSNLQFADTADGNIGMLQYNHTSNYLLFQVNNAEAMRLDASGHLLVGTTDNAVWNDTSGTGGINLRSDGILAAARNGGEPLLLNRLGTDGELIKFNKNGTTVGSIVTNAGALVVKGASTTAPVQLQTHDGNEDIEVDPDGFIKMETAGSERLRIDSSGNLMVGKTSTAFGSVGARLSSTDNHFTTDGGAVADFNRLTSDGSIVNFYKDTATVGSIGSSAGNSIYVGSGDVGVRFSDVNDAIYPMTTAGVNRDNAIDLGISSVRFDDIYATNGTIQTSDQNEKQDIAELTDAEQRVAVAAKGLLRKFRWKSAVEEKGDEARTHFGIIAQDLQAAFAAEGLDAGDYGMFISSTWTDEETGEERTRMGVRYSELLAFIIAAI